MAFFAQLIFYVIKAAFFAVLAYAGIVLGKKYRDKNCLQRRRMSGTVDKAPVHLLHAAFS